MNPAQQVNELLQAHGATLLRGKKHKVYQLRNGKTFTMAQTASDRRAAANQLSDLRRLLGLTKTDTTVGERRERRKGHGAAAPKLKLNTQGTMNSLAEQLQASGAVELTLRGELEDVQAQLALAQEHLEASRIECEGWRADYAILWDKHMALQACYDALINVKQPRLVVMAQRLVSGNYRGALRALMSKEGAQ